MNYPNTKVYIHVACFHNFWKKFVIVKMIVYIYVFIASFWFCMKKIQVLYLNYKDRKSLAVYGNNEKRTLTHNYPCGQHDHTIVIFLQFWMSSQIYVRKFFWQFFPLLERVKARSYKEIYPFIWLMSRSWNYYRNKQILCIGTHFVLLIDCLSSRNSFIHKLLIWHFKTFFNTLIFSFLDDDLLNQFWLQPLVCIQVIFKQ